MSTDLITISGDTMGTRYVAQFPETTPAMQSIMQRGLHNAVTQVDQQMSPWIEGSFVNAFNATPVGEWILMPTQAAAVIKKAIEIERKSRGAFSIAVAPQVRHLGFGVSPRNFGTSPKMGASAADAIELKGPRIRKTKGIEIDLCGIAKGYGVDMLAETLLSHNINDFMVGIDGELRCHGLPEIGQNWQVAIEAPIPEVRTTACVIPCSNLALATSGGYRNFDGSCEDHITHTVNPRTGLPLFDTSRAVVVAHAACCDADAWATALTVMSPIEAEAVIAQENINALLLKQEGGQTACAPHGAFV